MLNQPDHDMLAANDSGACAQYHKTKVKSKASDPAFTYSPFSRSFRLRKGSSAAVKLLLYRGFDYCISIGCDPLLGEKIEFAITDDVTGEPLYTNTSDDFYNYTEFTAESPRKTTITITVPGNSSDSAEGCVGVLIESRQL
jgi:hypothetical protein